MQRLLIRNISKLVSCDESDTVYENVDLYAEDGVIRAIGPKLEKPAEEVLDAGHMLCYPGLINTHHHLYQQFSRNLPQVQNMELFDWLKTLYEIWKNLDTDVVRLSSLTGMGELMKHGCTTCFDHHYVFPAGAGDLIGTQFEAASELGIRMHCSRGSMDLSVKDGGLPPDSVVQTVDEIMKDSARLIETYHDPAFGSMRQLALAPCSPFSVSAELLRQSAILARQYHVRLHTHLCETKDEENYMLAREGMRPLAFMQTLGWVGPDVWYAHGIHFNDDELKLLAETGTGVCHCPASNMKLASGIARIPDMLKLGVPVGLGTDVGCPYITHYDMWRELNHFVKYCGVTPAFALYSATKLNARLAGIGDVTGSVEADKQADLIVCTDDPLKSPSALRTLDIVVKGGYRIDKPQVKKMPEVERELDKFL